MDVAAQLHRTSGREKTQGEESEKGGMLRKASARRKRVPHVDTGSILITQDKEVQELRVGTASTWRLDRKQSEEQGKLGDTC